MKKQVVDWNGTPIAFKVDNPVELWRATTPDKEPMTNRWIDTFGSDDIFYDVGANVGIFTLYAALRRRCKVYAFEPCYHNFNSLNINIQLNDLDNVTAFPLSLHDEFDVNVLNISGLKAGEAFASFKYELEKETQFAQGSIGIPMDEIVKFLPVPTHIKIDVDGNEMYVVGGMKKTLKDSKLKSVLIEINGDEETAFKRIFEREGFHTKSIEERHPYRGRCFNYIFERGVYA